MKVLDKGFVEVIDTLGDDLTVVNSARVSFGKEKQSGTRQTKDLFVLAKHKHHSPFRHLQIQFHIKARVCDATMVQTCSGYRNHTKRSRLE